MIDWVAGRGDQVVLVMAKMGVDGDFQQRFLLMFEVDESGFIWRAHSFDDDHIDDALDLIDEWYKDSLPVELGIAVDSMRLGSRLARGDDVRDEFAATVSDRAEVLDHRSRSFGDFDKGGQIARLESGRGLYPPDLRILRSDPIETSSLGGVFRLLTGSSGEDAIELPRVYLVIVEDGVVTRAEYFDSDSDDVDAAVARFDELTSTTDDGVPEL